MHTPTKAQFQVVIDNLTKMLPFAQSEENLDMEEGVVPEKPTCGTTCCVAGWYTLAKDIESFSFRVGTYAIAKDLGFDPHYGDLEKWVHNNHELWGNEHGSGIFCETEAYSSPTRPKGAKTLADVVDHLKEVQARLPKNAQYPDVKSKQANDVPF